MPIVEPGAFQAGAWRQDFAFGARTFCDDPLASAFLQALSRRILRDPQARAYPDLMTLGYFCRRANVARLLAGEPALARRQGWGTVVHVAPSNIPINFAFSFVMGFLSGNSNIVRLPSQTSPQSTLFLQHVDALTEEAAFAGVGQRNLFVQTDRDCPVLDALVGEAQGLVVWGGDATVARFRALPKRARMAEAYFPDRVSSAMLDARAVLAADTQGRAQGGAQGQEGLEGLVRAFFNDSYLVDQNACSSPGPIFWLGDPADTAAAQARFWPALGALLDREYRLDPVARIDRMLDVMHLNKTLGAAVPVHQPQHDLWVMDRPEARGATLRFGTFVELTIPTPGAAARFLRPHEQTLTTFGIAPETVFEALKAEGAALDRIVPVGRALDIGLHWDGRDMLAHLSRLVQVG